ncbi:MAG: SMC-Scp complex subunit ScpB [Anaerolineaceae bacterium]|jgi:segregation and condensation protein B|nr:SMC-Scp complex subunit ScpB [Anaerolineaceae bacterium]
MSEQRNDNNNEEQAVKRIEALLFAAPGLTSVEQLTQATKMKKREVEAALVALRTHYSELHGIRLQEVKGQYQLVTAPEYATDIEAFLGLEITSRLTQAALEALAIVAYKQPTTRPEIDSIRGVNSDGVVRSLLSKGLIEELGRSEAPGRPILYGITPEFLQHFGLEGLDQLPEIDFEALFSSPQEAEADERRLLKD